MTARKKATKKKTAKKKSARKKVILRVPPTYTFEQLAYQFWASFGQGAGLPFKTEVIDAGTARYRAAVEEAVIDDSFANEGLRIETYGCCRSAGEIATSIAKFKDKKEIGVSDFNQACDLLEAIVSGGSGGIC